ncbi:MAG TPA: hypothetical protein VG797_10495, partial [Phycisphaerales bacterium]|nr:hypothetical protein [Phycisphaerales bacterium]
WGDRVCVIAMSTVDQENSPSNIRAAVRKLGNGLRVRVAVDRGRQSSERYPVAVRDTAVPRSFIIDAQGRLAWYGHPMDMDPVLESVVAGTWDLQQARECFAKSNAAGRETQRLASRYLEASDRRDLEGILAAAEAVCAYPVDDVRGLSPATWGWWVRVRTLAELGRGAEAEEVANLGMQTAGVADDPGALANMAGALSSSPKGLELAERAIALMREEEAKPANTVWEKYLRDGDKLRYAAIRHQCAAVLAEHARNGEAAELVRQAVEVWPDDKRLLPSRAQLVADLKKYEAAAR